MSAFPSSLMESPPDLPGITREVIHTDAIAWLSARAVMSGCSFVTSLPDICELSLKLPDYKEWFVHTAELVLRACPADGVVVFYQSDVKLPDTGWLDKSYLCNKAAERAGVNMVWHKIVCRQKPGTCAWGRPGYTHMLCYSPGVQFIEHKRGAFPDVLDDAGQFLWPKAMGVSACMSACKFIRGQTKSHTVVDPFCGQGTTLAIANWLGLSAIGLELSPRRAACSRRAVYDAKANRIVTDAPAADAAAIKSVVDAMFTRPAADVEAPDAADARRDRADEARRPATEDSKAAADDDGPAAAAAENRGDEPGRRDKNNPHVVSMAHLSLFAAAASASAAET